MPATPFISCAEAARRISQAHDEPLSRAVRLGLLLHLVSCRFCRRFRRQVHFIHSTLRAFNDHLDEVSPQHLSTQAKDRIILHLRNEG